jgi:hypothetical protein
MAIVSNEVKKFTERFENDANGQPIYQGWADPGAASATLGVWRIAKYTYNSTTNYLEKIEWADGETDNFDKIWDDRATYTYSS